MSAPIFLIEFSHDLQTDPDTMKRAEQVKHQVLEHPEVRNLINSAWTTAKSMILTAAEDPSSQLRIRVRDGLASLGQRRQGGSRLDLGRRAVRARERDSASEATRYVAVSVLDCNGQRCCCANRRRSRKP